MEGRMGESVGKWKTLKRKPKYGNGNTEVRREAAKAKRVTVSLSDVRAKY